MSCYYLHKLSKQIDDNNCLSMMLMLMIMITIITNLND